jgi:superfamily II DNA or RNA helicase
MVEKSLARMPQEDSNEAVINLLTKLIEEQRLKVKVFSRGKLHAKAYIFDYKNRGYEKGIGVVGSSNFSLSGLTHNTELNVIVQGNDNHHALMEWFERIWNQGEDFNPNLMHALSHSWAKEPVTPYEIYLKSLYELVRNRLDSEDALDPFWQTEIMAVLTDFQRNAVKRAVQIIRDFGGAFVSDVVGLGKSYIGSAIIKHFQRYEHARPLIICPASLVDMWEHYNEAYRLDARVLSIGMLRLDLEDPSGNILLDDERYRDRDFILVDESHNFRNQDTQRYRILQNYLNNGYKDKKCVFLTATPYNRSVWDIYHQIKLFHLSEITQIPIDPPSLRNFFHYVERGDRRMAELLSQIMVRRTRMDVLRWYGYDEESGERVDPFDFEPYKEGEKRTYVLVGGEAQFFPERQLQTIQYNIDETYKGLYDQLRGYLGRGTGVKGVATEHLTYARYGLWHYVVREKQEQSPYDELKRAGINLRGLMRVALFKRLESSVCAFCKTIEKMLSTHKSYLAAIKQGIIPAGEQAADLLEESDRYEEIDLMEALEAVTGRYDIKDFNIEPLISDLEHDIAIFSQMLALVRPITPERDNKLQTLKEKLFTVDDPLASEKCLVFTQFADTAQYLFDNLNGENDSATEVIYGTGKNKMRIAARFAPIANPQVHVPDSKPNIDLLIATDVMSEGLNLQDCDRVINYDLHWNPVRLIQRFGRIDRIGSKHDKIFGYNFLPEAGLEAGLGLTEILQHRINEINTILGGDAAILSPKEQLQPEAFIAIYQGENIQRFEDVDTDDLVDLVEAEELMRQIRDNDPELFERISSLSDGVRSARAHTTAGAIVHCKVGQYQQLYQVDENGEIIRQNIAEILSLLKCDPEVSALSIATDHNKLVNSIMNKFKREVEEIRAEMEVATPLTNAQTYIIQQLRIYANSIHNENEISRIGLLSEYIKQPPTYLLKQELNQIQRARLEGKDLVATVERLVKRFNLEESFNKVDSEDTQKSVDAYVVCSLGLTHKD